MYRIEAYVPQYYNDGTLIPVELIKDLELFILSFSNGFSVSHEDGVWQDKNGTIYKDHNLLFKIDMDDPTMVQIARNEIRSFILDTLNQKEAYVLLYKLENVMLINNWEPVDNESALTVPMGSARW